MGESTPICRCRVLYLGSAVPRQSKDGLQGIQEPLRTLYPSEGALGAKGIDSWLSVWSNGILLENVDENLKQVTRFFPIESLHYCAAVRQVLIPERGSTSPPEPKFLPLDSPFARMPKAQHPPIFAAILRRTTGIKVLECHVFICKREAAANALVRCCFHAYADNSYAKQLENGPGPGSSTAGSVYGTLGGGLSKSNGDLTSANTSNIGNGWRSRAGSTTTINSLGRQSNGVLPNGYNGGNHSMLMNGSNGSSAAEGYQSVKNIYASSADLNVVDDGEGSLYNGDANHKVWNGSQDQLDNITSLESPYEIFSGNHSTLGRPARARQISAPIPVPPPPLKEESKKKKDKKIQSKQNSSQSLSGTLIRPKPIHGNSLPRPGMHPHLPHSSGGSMIYGPIMNQRQYHTLSHRGHPPNSGPPIMSPMHQHQHQHQLHHHHQHQHQHHQHQQHQHQHQHQHQQHQHHHHHQPPQQMMMGPPLAALHHHQIPVMLPQQYATLQSSRSTKKKKSKDKKMNGGIPSGAIPVGMPLVPPIYGYHQGPPPPHPQSLMNEPRPLAMSNRKLAQSAGNGLDDSGSGAESPGGTGIYRRKGHLNERAFSYSIRQEHRSRSHGSLASLQFNPPDMKKEREIAQMVAGLELNDNDHRHMQMNRRPSGNGMLNGGPIMNGNGGIPVVNGGYASFGKQRR